MRKQKIIKIEFKRYLFSYRTIVFLLVITLLSLASFLFSYAEKMELIQQLNNPAEDLNVESLQNWLTGYNGFNFFFTFYNMSDEFYIMVLLIYAWIGIFVSSEITRQRESGYGNWIVSRMGYFQYARVVMVAQTFYIAVVVGIAVAIQLFFAFLLGGKETLFYKSGTHIYSFANCLLIVLAIYIILTLYCVLINLISMSSISSVRGIYLTQVIPVMCFAIVPMILCSTLANVFGWPQFLVDMFVPFNYLSMILRLLNTFYLDELISLVASIILFAIVTVISVRGSVRKMERNYI